MGTEATTKNQYKTQDSPVPMNNEIGEPIEKNQRTAHHWKSATVLVVGDSMVHGLIEPKLGKKGSVKVRSFPGAIVDDMKDYIKPLLLKKPSKIILHFVRMMLWIVLRRR